MQLDEFKRQFIKNELGVSEDFGTILSVVDFGNVNFWFKEDRQDADNQALSDTEVLKIDLCGLYEFAALFSQDIRFYYGSDKANPGSMGFISAAKGVFGKNRVFSKQIQYVRHHLQKEEIETNTRQVFIDTEGVFVKIPKCNFDVEISIDSVRKMAEYDTLALFSGDADFAALARFLKKSGKKVILVKGGNITSRLRESVDLVVNAQKIKRYIAQIVQK